MKNCLNCSLTVEKNEPVCSSCGFAWFPLLIKVCGKCEKEKAPGNYSLTGKFGAGYCECEVEAYDKPEGL